jgi:hypothetical protein
MTKRVHRTKTTTTIDGKEIIDEVEEETSSWVASYPAIAGGLAGLVTALVAILTYYSQSNKDIEARIFEAKKPFFDKQKDLYADAMGTLSKIANSSSPSQDDLNHFWWLYWGQLAAVEDRNVDRAMVNFGARLSEVPLPSRDCLVHSSLLLSHCVKQSWSTTWNVALDTAPELLCNDDSFSKVETTYCAKK